jgi:predicted AlkP superfamily pyrophosphatase or phosphodiesterase
MQKILLFFILCPFAMFAKTKQGVPRPKLVVGLVIDQMRYDFLYRYAERYQNDGFQRLIAQGHSFENMHINYLPSYTGPGHACIYTGSVPAVHGIASNDWIDQLTGNKVYCTDDAQVTAVGGTQKAGKMSPKNLWVSTITDELRLATNFASKTIAISVKDRGAILPGGHTANAAYWMDDSNGVFMSSSFYMVTLPSWVSAFNAKDMASSYLKGGWQTLYPISSYAQSTADNNAYEGKFSGEASPVFPHNTAALKRSDVKKTPFGNTMVLEFARQAIEHEKLGEDAVCDFLAISLSSPDYIGHQFGPNAIEVEDTYLRLDAEIAAFLNYLDGQIGKGEYTLFLTADHGAAHNPQFLKDMKIPAGAFFGSKLKSELNTQLKARFGVDRLVMDVGENFVWLNHPYIDSLQLDAEQIKKEVLRSLYPRPEIQFALDMASLQQSNLPSLIRDMATNGYNQKRSGDILLLLYPGWLDAYATTGTTHGTWNPYDTHIPMLWYGWGVQHGVTHKRVHMTDIAPTLSSLLHIQEPNGCVGQCMHELFAK